MSSSGLAAVGSSPFIASSAGLNTNFTGKGYVEITANATKEIALAIIYGILAAVGSILLAMETVASFGTLPFVLLSAGTLMSAVTACANVHFAVKISKELSENELPKIKLTHKASLHEKEQSDNFYTLKAVGKKESEKIHKNGIHPLFVCDCTRSTTQVILNGQTLKQFLEQSEDLEAPGRTFPSLQNEADNDTVCLEAKREKLMGELSRVVTEKLGANSPLLGPISLVLTQHFATTLELKMQKLASDNYQGIFQRRPAIEPVIFYTYSLEFPTEGAAVAKVTVRATGRFKFIDLNREGPDYERELHAPCTYRGQLVVSIEQNGQTSLETDVSLVP